MKPEATTLADLEEFLRASSLTSTVQRQFTVQLTEEQAKLFFLVRTLDADPK